MDTKQSRLFLLSLLISGFAWTNLGLDTTGHVHAQCRFAPYPTLCFDTLSRTTATDDILSILIDKTIYETKVLQVQSRHDHTDDCNDLVKMSLNRLNQSIIALKKSPEIYKEDIQTWLSAALTFQQTCKDDVTKNTNLASEFVFDASKRMDYISQLISNALSLANRISGNSLPENSGGHGGDESEAFPNWAFVKEKKLFEGKESGGISANAVVAKDGTGDYTTISGAISGATGGRYVIHVKAGVYNEKLRINKDGITLIGDGKFSSVVVGSSSVGHGASLTSSATVTIFGDSFIAIDMGFQNTAGPQGEQAVAVNVASDHSVFFRCAIVGNQDTLYAHALRQFYRNCDIYGTIDFIFGNAAAVFQNCNLVLRRPKNDGINAILANGRTDPGQNTGFSVQKCSITADSSGSHESYLGRPWKPYSRAVVMQSSIGGMISSRGWNEWEGAGSSVLKTLYFAEYANTGAGASTSNRVRWAGYHVLDSSEASKFTVSNFIGGSSWLPSTGVIFDSGL